MVYPRLVLIVGDKSLGQRGVGVAYVMCYGTRMVPGLDEVRKGAVVVRKAVVRRDEDGKEYC
jgi:hypothetical protein